MARVIWSPEASRRLIDISAYMLLTAPEREASVVDRITEAVGRLREFPRMGRPTARFRQRGARELIVDQYCVVYSTDGDVVQIATILHSAMDIPSRLQDLLDREP